MNGFMKGRCDMGQDLVNCVYESLSDPMISKCSGENKVVAIPDTFECKE